MDDRIFIQHYSSPCGEMVLGSFGGRLCLCNWLKEKHPGRVDRRLKAMLKAGYEEAQSDIIQETRRQLDEYFKKTRTSFDIPLLFAGTEFQEKVWHSLMEIPYGQTVTYGELAARLGMGNAVRAVANANGANAISVLVPCHRVIGSGNKLTGYGGGLDAKRFLLELEQSGETCLHT